MCFVHAKVVIWHLDTDVTKIRDISQILKFKHILWERAEENKRKWNGGSSQQTVLHVSRVSNDSSAAPLD